MVVIGMPLFLPSRTAAVDVLAEFAEVEVVRSLGMCFAPFGGYFMGERIARGAKLLWGVPGGSVKRGAEAVGRRSRRGRSPQEAVRLSWRTLF